MRILAIESSADETAAAVVEDGKYILGSAVATSTEMHRKYGGIVPEVAAREHLKSMLPVIIEALTPLSSPELSPLRHGFAGQATINYQLSIRNSIDAIAVSSGPGLIGSLLIGVETAKTLSMITGKPLIPVNHVLAHMYANFLESSQENSSRAESRDNLDHPTIEFPAISLVVSGGHTELFLMKSASELQWIGGTLDDAAGEAFDKTARLLGFENQGGPAIQRAAQKFSTINSQLSIRLPRPLMDESFNFSFSGLKTAILREWKSYPQHEENLINAFAYEVQESITDVLVKKTLHAAQAYNARAILLGGGVSANLRLREKLKLTADSSQLTASIHVPPIQLCTDNAVYIAAYAFYRGQKTDWHDVNATPDMSVEVTH